MQLLFDDICGRKICLPKVAYNWTIFSVTVIFSATVIGRIMEILLHGRILLSLNCNRKHIFWG